MTKCKCGGEYLHTDGLDGYYCNKCNKWVESVDEHEASLSVIYDQERIKAIRGLPVNEIIYGTDGRGKVKVSIPVYASEEEAKFLIDMNVSLLKYTINKCNDCGLDIGSKR